MNTRRKSVFGFAVILTIIVVVGVSAIVGFRSFRNASEWVKHTDEVIANLQSLEAQVVHAESAERGFLLTGKDKYQQDFLAAIGDIPEYKSALLKQLSNNPEQTKRLHELFRLVDRKLHFLQQKIQYKIEHPEGEGHANIDTGHEIMSAAARLIDEMTEVEKGLLKEREESSERAENISLAILVLGTIINLVLVSLLIRNIGQAFARQRSAEQELKKTNTELEKLAMADKQRNWVLNGANEINSQMRAANDLQELADFVTSGLATYLDARLAALYVLNDESRRYDMLASFGFENTHASYALHQGLVGQAAYEGRLMTISDLPEGYTPVQSGTGQAAPRCVVLLPLIYNEQVNGVLELAFFETPDPKRYELLEFIRKNIASGVNTGKMVAKMNALNARLHAQQEELQSTNEELKSQSEALQASEEELRVQQEELQQINAELEEKAQLLKEKNDALEMARQAVLEKANQVEQASKYKSEFLANMSHELRTPLNSILILAKLLAENKQSNLSDKQIEYARVIHKSGNDLLNLINDILDLSKIEAGKLDLSPEEVHISEITGDIRSLFQELANEKKIQFNIHVSPGVPETIKTDKVRVEQVVRNLLSNAFKFTMSKGRVEMVLEMAKKDHVFHNPALQHAEHVLMVKVSDTGIGIPKEKQQLIFEAFQQADGSTSRKFGGTGLGLSISRQLAGMLGGELQLESIEQKGSTFTLCIPVTMPEPEGEAKPSFDMEDELPDDRKQLQPGDDTLLIIEDDRITAELLQRYARERNFKTIVALQGDLGLYYAKLYKPSAIILDVSLPVMDGYTVLQKLKEDPEVEHIPVHMISAMDKLPAEKTRGKAGFTGKPFNREDVSRLFENLKNSIPSNLRHILIIEDDTIHQEYLTTLIREEEKDVQCFVAASAAEARQMAAQIHFDCIILDLKLSDEDGIVLLKELRNIEAMAQTPIIVYTARTVTAEEDKLIRQYANTIILKGMRSQKRLIDEISIFINHLQVKDTPRPADNPAPAALPAETQNVLAGKKVLLVDDDMRNVFSLSAILNEQKLEVVVAGDGREALQKLDEHPDTDIVLMDIMMPEMDGYEATRQIRKNPAHKQLPVIALTAKAMKEDREKCLEAGASDYITKPVNTEQLLSLMRVWLYEG